MDDLIGKKDYKQKARKVVEETTHTTLRVTKTIFIIVFIIMILVTVIFSLYTFVTSKDLASFLERIATYCIGGFWAFFLGYFGWRMGQTIETSFFKLRWKKQ